MQTQQGIKPVSGVRRNIAIAFAVLIASNVVSGFGWHHAVAKSAELSQSVKDWQVKFGSEQSSRARHEARADEAEKAQHLLAAANTHLAKENEKLRHGKHAAEAKVRQTQTALRKEELRRQGADRTAQIAVLEAHSVGAKSRLKRK